MLEKVKSSPCGLVVWVGISSMLHILLFKSNINNGYQMVQRGLIGLLAIVFTLPMHELLHFVLLKIFSKDKVKIQFAKDPMGLPGLRTVYSDKITNWQKIMALLAPFTFLTLFIDLAFVFGNKVELFFFIVAVCNCVGCYFDIIDVLRILQCKFSQRKK